MGFDLTTAKLHYSDEQIASFLSEQHGFNYQATKQHYSDEQIIDFMAGRGLMDKPAEKASFRETVSAVGSGLKGAAVDVFPKTLAEAYRGGDTPLRDNSFAAGVIDENKAEMESRALPPELDNKEVAFGFTLGHIKRGLENLGYTGATAIGGMVAGGAAAAPIPIPGARIIGGAVGAGALSGAVAYRASKDQFVSDIQGKLLKSNPSLTEQQWQGMKEAIESDATLYGLYEAIPEAAGNAIMAGLIRAPVGQYLKAIPVIKNGLTRAVVSATGKVGIGLGEELATEGYTAYKQSGIEAQHGLRDEPIESWQKGIEDVAHETTVMTLATMGLGGAVNKLTSRGPVPQQAPPPPIPKVPKSPHLSDEEALEFEEITRPEVITTPSPIITQAPILEPIVAPVTGTVDDVPTFAEATALPGQEPVAAVPEQPIINPIQQVRQEVKTLTDADRQARFEAEENAWRAQPITLPKHQREAMAREAMKRPEPLPTANERWATEPGEFEDEYVHFLDVPEDGNLDNAKAAIVIKNQQDNTQRFTAHVPGTTEVEFASLNEAVKFAEKATEGQVAIPESAQEGESQGSEEDAGEVEGAQAAEEVGEDGWTTEKTFQDGKVRKTRHTEDGYREARIFEADGTLVKETRRKRVVDADGYGYEAVYERRGDKWEITKHSKMIVPDGEYKAIIPGFKGLGETNEQGETAEDIYASYVENSRADEGLPRVPEAQQEIAEAANEAATSPENNLAEPSETVEQPLPKKPLPHSPGSTVKADTETGNTLDLQYAVAEAGDLVTSHGDDFKANANYPKELQPRERERGSYELQVNEIANKLKPSWLGANPKVSEGAPVVGPDGVVESGNGRAMALRQAHARGRAKEYTTWLKGKAKEFGLDPEQLNNMKQPVLVRIRKTEMTPEDRVAFTQDANTSGVSTLNAVEQAVQDAKRIGDLSDFAASETGVIDTASNKGFIDRFLHGVGQSERNRLISSDNHLSQEGIGRIRAAVFALAYESPEIISKVVESTDNNVRNMTNAMLLVAPKMAKMRAAIKAGNLHNLDLGPLFARMVEDFSRLRSEKKSVEAELAHGNMFKVWKEDEKSILLFLDQASSAKEVKEFLDNYIKHVYSLGNPKQQNLLGKTEIPQAVDLIRRTLNQMAEQKDGKGKQTGLFGLRGNEEDNTGKPADERYTLGLNKESEGIQGEGPTETEVSPAEPLPPEQSVKPDVTVPVSERKKTTEAAERTLNLEGRASDGKPIMPGDTFRTSAGRDTTPYPKYSTKRTTKADERKASQWLIDNALAEAKARNDDFNQTVFSGADASNFSQADTDSMLMYLFDEESAKFPIPKPITRPLVTVPVREREKLAEPKQEAGVYTFEEHKEIKKKLFSGDVAIAEHKENYKRLKENKAALAEELSKRTMKQLAPNGAGGLKKSEVIEKILGRFIGLYSLDKSVQYSPFEGETYESARDKVVESMTQADLDEFAKGVDEYRDEVAKAREGATDPKTLKDFRSYIDIQRDDGKTSDEAFMSLTPEQREEFDKLLAGESRELRRDRLEKEKTTVRTAGQKTESVIVEGTHKKHGHKIWTVQLEDKVDPESYKALLSNAKRMGGQYVNTMQARMWKTDWGFQFKDEESAKAFVSLTGGDTEAAQEKLKERRDAFKDDKGQSATERLNEMADNLEERGEEKLNQDRKVNTSRRAGMAASAEAKAEADISLAKTMRKIAAAIESGTANLLDYVRTKSQVEMLSSYVRIGKDNFLNKQYPSYQDFLNHKADKTTIEAADHSSYPRYTVYRSHLAEIGREFSLIDGAKKLSVNILKLADDVTAEYKKFAKENLHKVSRFTKASGGLATFDSKENAEKSIKGSGLKGKAVVFSVKRGEHIIIMSPAMAKEQGVWEGDDDKKINLSESLAEEIIQKGKQNKVHIPYHLETTLDARKRLRAMGLDGPVEFRAALREFIALQEPPKAPDKIKELERKMVGRRNDGLDFFPTPESTVSEMIETADIQEGMKVLEPSAGMGHIAEQIRETGVDPDVVEMSGDRRELLEAKGFNLIGRDFMDVAEGGYDRIIMNPPFSNRRDAEHVQHAYTLLKPGGRIVAIMGEGVFFGQDKKAQGFREWLESVGGTSEKLTEGTFLDSSLPVNTGVNSRMVVIDKAETPQGVTLYSQSPGLYSKLSEVASDKFTGMKAASVMNYLLKNGVKKVEIEAMGLDSWLASKKPTDKVTQEDLQNFVKANQVELEDVVLSDSTELTDDIDKRIREISQWPEDAYLAKDPKDQDELNRLSAEWEKADKKQSSTQFSTYQEPGEKSDYREMFVVAPSKVVQDIEYKNAEEYYKAGQYAKDYADIGLSWKQLNSYQRKAVDEAYREANQAYKEFVQGQWQDGHSSYSDIKNPIVRIRFNSRTDAEGRKILFIEEIQPPNKSNQKKMPTYLVENWRQLGVKRVLAYAKENGFDGVSWTSGSQQEARYDLTERVSGGVAIDTIDRTVDILGDILRGYAKAVQPLDMSASSPLVAGGLNAPDSKTLRDRTSVDTKGVGDILKGDPFTAHGYGGLDVPSKRLVASGVLSMLHNGEILRSVVRLVPIDVVNGFTREKASSKLSLSDKAMLKSDAPIHALDDIASLVQMPTEDLVRIVAFLSTVDISGLGELNSGRVSLKDLSASRAGQGNSLSPGQLVARHTGFRTGVFNISASASVSFLHDVSPVNDSKRLINYIPINRGSQGLKRLYDVDLGNMFKAYGKEKVGETFLGKERKSLTTTGDFKVFDQNGEQWNTLRSREDAEKYVQSMEGKLELTIKESGAEYEYTNPVPFLPITDKTPAAYTVFSQAESFNPAKVEALQEDMLGWFKEDLSPFLFSRLIVNVQDEIVVDDSGVKSQAEHKKLGKKGRILGATKISPDKMSALITLSFQGKEQAEETARHEQAHWLLEAVSSEQDKTRILDIYDNNNESFADGFAAWRVDPKTINTLKQKDFIRLIFNRMKAVLDAVYNGLRGKGFKTSDEVFKSLFFEKMVRDARTFGGKAESMGDTDPRIQYSQETPQIIRDKFDVPEERTTLSALKGAFGTAKFNKAEAKKAISGARTKLVDRFHPIEQLGREPYLLHRMLGNAHLVISTFLQHGNLSWQDNALTVKTKNKGFLPWLHAMKDKDARNLFYWMATKRAEVLESQDRENWLDKDSRDEINDAIFGGLSPTERTAKEAEFEKLNTEFQEWNKNILDIAQESGLISAEQRVSWTKDFYLPFYRILEDETTKDDFLSGPHKSKRHISAQIKRLRGGEEKLGDPIENILRNWSHLIQESQRNVARSAAAESAVSMGLAEEVPKSELVKILGAKTTKSYGVQKESATMVFRVFEDKAAAATFADEMTTKTGNKYIVSPRTNTSVMFGRKEDFSIISYQKNGEPIYIRLEDKDLFDALSQLNTKAFDSGLLKIMSGAKRLLTRGATFGPAFRITNLLRDTLHTSVVAKSFMPFIDSARGSVKVWQESPEYIELMASGGGFGNGWLDSGDPKAMARSVEKIIKREGQGAAGKILNTPKKILNFWEEVGHASEMAARVQLYKNLRMKGVSHLEAAFEARDLLDFHLSGAANSVRVIIAVVPFLNARMQGLDRLYRGAKENPGAFFTKGAMVAGASLLLWSLFKDDDRYKELEDWEKWQYHHFWIGDDHYRLPKAFEVGAIFSSLFETVANVLDGQEDFEFFKRFLSHTLTQTFALGLPTAVGPAIEAFANKSTFTQRPIENMSLLNLPPGERSNPWTPAILKDLGRGLNLSPVKMQHIIRGHTATFGTIFITLADALYRPFVDAPSPPAMRVEEVPALGRFMRSSEGRTKYGTRYYEFAREVQELAATVNNYKNLGDVGKARKFAVESRDKLKYRKFISRTNRELSIIRKHEKLIWADPDMSATEKRDRLNATQKQKNDIFLKAYNVLYANE